MKIISFFDREPGSLCVNGQCGVRTPQGPVPWQWLKDTTPHVSTPLARGTGSCHAACLYECIQQGMDCS